MITGVRGQGKDLALLHGWGLGSTVWQPVVDTLAMHCRVHLIDLPGYGDTPANTADFAQTAQALIDALPCGITLCGWSLGSLLALQAAHLAPQRIARLVLVGATPCFTQRGDWASAQAPALLDTFNDAVRNDPAATLQRFIALLNQGDAQAHRLTRTLVAGLHSGKQPGTAPLLTGLDWLRNIDLRTSCPGIATPTLLIHGECDPLMPLAAGEWLATHLPAAQLEVFARTAHAPFLADPAHFAALIAAFCDARR